MSRDRHSRAREASRGRSHSSRSRSDSRDSRSTNKRRRHHENSRSRSNSRSPSRDRSSRKRYRSVSRDRSRGRDRGRGRNQSSRSRSRSASSSVEKKSIDKTLEEKNISVDNAPAESFVKATVTESNGEISCSIEETNRIRAALGLKPLVVDRLSKEAEAVTNFKDQQKKEQENEIKERLQNAKDKRLSRQKLMGPTLADLEGESEDLLSAAAWVKRSRVKEVENKEKEKVDELKKEEERRRQRELSKYDSKDLRGLAVKHGGDEFEVGDEVILTLADSSLLNHGEDGRLIGLNTEGDILENVNLADKDRRLEREKRLKRNHQPVYAGYDDAEFAEGAVVGVKPSILPQYDKEKKAGPKLILSDEGIAVSSKDSEAAALGEENESIRRRQQQSLSMETKEMSDYLTPTEFAQFNKPKKEKKKRKIRKKETNIVEELEASLEVNADQNGLTDRGKRGDGMSQLQIMRMQESDRRLAYDLAVKSADAKVKAAVAQSQARGAPPPVQEEDDDAEIAESLARARRLALQLQKKNASMDVQDMPESKEDAGYQVAERVRQTAQKYHHSEGSTDSAVVPGVDDPNALDAEGRKRDGTLVFTSTTEFTTRLQARLQEKARSRAEAALKGMNVSDSESEGEKEATTRRVVKKKVSQSKPLSPKKSGWVDLGDGMEVVNEWEESKGRDRRDEVKVEDVDEEEEVEEEEEADEETDEQMAFIHGQPLVARGMAATLELLKGSGDLRNKVELAGRAKDPRQVDDKDYGVKIEYRDKMGRELTKKEAFRQLSYRFHGFGPGTKKREKKMREMQMSQHVSSSRAGVAADKGTMRTLTRAQEGTGKAYITLQGGVSATDAAAELAASVAKKAAKLKRDK